MKERVHTLDSVLSQAKDMLDELQGFVESIMKNGRKGIKEKNLLEKFETK